MTAYRESDFENMATDIVNRFMSGQKLADVAAEMAMQNHLNPDQIQRMVQAANTMAFLQLMEQQKSQGGHDMTGEFDPIDSRQVIQHIMQSVPMMGHDESMPHAEPDGDEGPLPDEMHPATCVDAPGEGGALPHDSMCTDKAIPDGDDDDGPFPKGQKQKAKDDSEKKPEKKAPPKEKESEKEAMFRGDRLRKLADVLEDQYRQAEWAFDEHFSKLSHLLRRAQGAPTAEAFEKDALALHGDAIGVSLLNMVQSECRWPVTSPDDASVKCAALADRHLVDDTECNATFALLVKIAREAAKLQEGAAHVRSQCS